MGETISATQLATELDVDEATVRAYVDQLAGDEDLVHDGELTMSAASLVRTALRVTVSDPLEPVRTAAVRLAEAEAAVAAARATRDEVVRAAAAAGAAKTTIATAAGVSREYVHQVLRHV